MRPIASLLLILVCILPLAAQEDPDSIARSQVMAL